MFVLDKILSEDTESSLSIYELYEEVVVMSKNMEKLYSLRNLTNDILLQRPRFFVVEKEHNRQIELHVNSIHKKINNTDNVTATVTKSVNESSSQNIETTSNEASQKEQRKTSTNDKEFLNKESGHLF